MNPLRVSLRFPVTNAPEELQPAIPAFHRFIQRGLVEGALLDVADYRHVPRGPGVMLIAHDVDYGLTHDAFTVVRKRSASDTAATQVTDLLRMGLGFMEELAADHDLDVSVDPARVTVAVHDRALGTRDEVAEQLRSQLEPVAAELYGEQAKVAVVESEDPRHAPAVQVEADPEAAAGLLDRLGGSRAPGQSPWDVPAEEVARLRQSGEDFVLLDVREDTEVQTVNLDGTHIPLAELEDRVDELDRDAHVVVHCRAGNRGAKAVAQLREAGFSDAWNLNGGLMAWIDRVDPTLPRY